MWYYELNQKPFGPVSQETIQDELKAGRITHMTLVWREGWPQWRHLGETELAGKIPPQVAPTITPPIYVPVQKYKKTTPSSLTKLFWWWFGLNLSCFPYYSLFPFLYEDFPTPNLTIIGLILLFWLPLCAGAVIQFIYIYKLWQIVQDGFARTSPGQAVGFMFIPYFNYYWFLPVYHGLAKDMNAYIDRHFRSTSGTVLRKAHPGLALGFVITTWASLLLGMGLGLVMYFVIFFSVLNGGLSPETFQNFMIPLVIVYGALMILEIIMFFDFYLTAKSILIADNNNS